MAWELYETKSGMQFIHGSLFTGMADATSSLRAAVERLQNSQKDENSVEACKDGLVHLRRLVACAASEARKAELELQQADVAFNATWTSLQSVELERKYVLKHRLLN